MNISWDLGNMQQNSWERGNLTRVNFRDHLWETRRAKEETPIFLLGTREHELKILFVYERLKHLER